MNRIAYPAPTFDDLTPDEISRQIAITRNKIADILGSKKYHAFTMGTPNYIYYNNEKYLKFLQDKLKELTKEDENANSRND